MKKYLLSFIALLFVILTHAQTLTPTLWGMTDDGIFNYNISTGVETNVSGYGSGSAGEGSLFQANNGVLYGVTGEGGANSDGIMFSYNIPSGAETDIHDFDGADGAVAFRSLIQLSNGLLYGTTTDGGANGVGNIFSYDPSTEIESDLYDFNKNSGSGYNPTCTLVQAGNGLLYGTLTNGGAYGDGEIFSFNINSNLVTDVYDFFGSPDGEKPLGTLMLANNGSLYGMTLEGGNNNDGTIYSYDVSSGVYSSVYDFGNGTDGSSPYYGSLIQAGNGLLYGMTTDGGVNNSGIIFSFDINGNTETKLYDFGSGTDGSRPYGSLLQASNGLLYGMTYGGGANDEGMTFSYDISSGTETDVYDFGPYEGYPFGNLIEIDYKFETSVKDSICPGNSITLSANPGGSSYYWSPSTGLSATTGSSVTANPTVTTVYTVSGTISDTIITYETETVKINPTAYITIEGDSLISNYANGNQWYYMDTLLQDATQQVYVAKGYGEYELRVSGSCPSADSTGWYGSGGIKQISLQNYIKTFPNPFNTTVTLNINSSATGLENWYLQITDVLGRIVYTKQSLNYNNEIDLSTLPVGMYFITVMNNADRAVIPVVKQ